MPEKNWNTGEKWVIGAAAGIVAGIVGMLFLMIASALVGQGFWLPLQLESGIFFGANAILGGVGPTLVGIVTLLAVSALLGVAYVFVAESYFEARAISGKPAMPAFLGLAFGFVLWALMTVLFLPILNPVMGARMAWIPVSWFFANLLFGGVLSSLPPLSRRVNVVRPLVGEIEGGQRRSA